MENLIKRLEELAEYLLKDGHTKSGYHITTINLAISNLKK